MAENKHDSKQHQHGHMDTTDQEKTFEGFVRISAWAAGGIIIFLVLLYGIAG
jgi:hypothetical protein